MRGGFEPLGLRRGRSCAEAAAGMDGRLKPVQAQHTLASISYLQGPSRETVLAHQSPWGWDGWQGVKGMAGLGGGWEVGR